VITTGGVVVKGMWGNKDVNLGLIAAKQKIVDAKKYVYPVIMM